MMGLRNINAAMWLCSMLKFFFGLSFYLTGNTFCLLYYMFDAKPLPRSRRLPQGEPRQDSLTHSLTHSRRRYYIWGIQRGITAIVVSDFELVVYAIYTILRWRESMQLWPRVYRLYLSQLVPLIQHTTLHDVSEIVSVFRWSNTHLKTEPKS
jgi:hypothetical protein